jgi:hypothetical protein
MHILHVAWPHMKVYLVYILWSRIVEFSVNFIKDYFLMKLLNIFTFISSVLELPLIYIFSSTWTDNSFNFVNLSACMSLIAKWVFLFTSVNVRCT